MQVTSGAEWYTKDGTDNKRSYAVSFDLEDLAQTQGQEFVDGLDFAERLRALNNMADATVVAYVAKNGGMPWDYAKRRMEELRNIDE